MIEVSNIKREIEAKMWRKTGKNKEVTSFIINITLVPKKENKIKKKNARPGLKSSGSLA